MKLKELNSFEYLNRKELQFVVGGMLTVVESQCWKDSSSRDSKKNDTGADCSKKLDLGILVPY